MENNNLEEKEKEIQKDLNKDITEAQKLEGEIEEKQKKLKEVQSDIKKEVEELEEIEKEEHDKKYEIIVNGQKHIWEKKHITFDEVISLDKELPKPGPTIEFTVTYKNAVAPKHSGTMSKGDIVTVKDGTIFNARYTDKS